MMPVLYGFLGFITVVAGLALVVGILVLLIIGQRKFRARSKKSGSDADSTEKKGEGGLGPALGVFLLAVIVPYGALFYLGDERLRSILLQYWEEELILVGLILIATISRSVGGPVGKRLSWVPIFFTVALLGTIVVVSIGELWPKGSDTASTPTHTTPRHATRSQCDGAVQSVTLNRAYRRFSFVSGNCRFLHDLEMPSNSAGDCVLMNGVLQCGAGREQAIRVDPPYRVLVTLHSTSTGAVTYNFIRCPWGLPRSACFQRLIAGRR